MTVGPDTISSSADRGSLIAGAASVDLTPKARGTYLAGFGLFRRALGVRDPITARALYLSNGVESVAIVSVDFVGLLLDDVETIRRHLGPDLGPALLLQSTHTHAGPDTIGYWGPGLPWLLPLLSGRRPAYMRRACREIARCVETAARRAAPARLRVAVTAAPKELTKNIRRPDQKDDTITVLRAESPEGAGIGTLVHWTCHPETLWDRYRFLSADFPGALRPVLDERLGGVTLFVNGALGGMVTANIPDDAAIERRVAFMQEIGVRVAEHSARAIESSETVVGPEDVDIRKVGAAVEVPVNNWRFRLARRLGVLTRPTWRDGAPLRTEVTYLRVGPVEIAGLPGEPLPSVGEAVKRRLTAPHKVVFGLSNDELGYILTESEYHDPLYAYERTMSMGPRTWAVLEAKLVDLVRQGTAPRR